MAKPTTEKDVATEECLLEKKKSLSCFHKAQKYFPTRENVVHVTPEL